RYPMVLFLCLVSAIVFSTATRAFAPNQLWWSRAAWPSGVIFMMLVLVVLSARQMDMPFRQSDVIAKERTVSAMTSDLRSLVPEGSSVQVMETVAGGIHALLRLGIRQPTRFIEDFMFYEPPDDPRIQALRSEFLSELTIGKPAAILVAREGWIRHNFDRLEEFPELNAFIGRHYRLTVGRPEYRIYVRLLDE
ncbi:MAG: hypothetical protein NTZ05_02790, partial [Chloroflexi bacterium]|nr:hypothetical protein [Chloroflexota bacterium]